MDKIIELKDMDRKTAEDESLKMCTDLFNRVDQNSIDIPKLELALRNMFDAACQWKDALAGYEAKGIKSYEDGLDDMLEASLDIYEEDYDAFLCDAFDARNKLLDKFTNAKI